MNSKVGDYVLIHGTGSYGKIIEIEEIYRPSASQKQKQYVVKYIDVNTGKSMVCPDSRCVDGCVICSHTSWEDNILPMSSFEVELFKQDGLITE